MKSIYLFFLLLAVFWLYMPLTLWAQLTLEQEETVKQTAQRYTALLQRLGSKHNDTDAFEGLATEVFLSGARVYDDFLKGEIMDEYMVYLGKVRDYRGQLRLSFSDYDYRYKRQYGLSFGIVKITKNIYTPRTNYSTIKKVVYLTPKSMTLIFLMHQMV